MKCLQCGSEDLMFDYDDDYVECWGCGSKWESVESFHDEMNNSSTSSIIEGDDNED